MTKLIGICSSLRNVHSYSLIKLFPNYSFPSGNDWWVEVAFICLWYFESSVETFWSNTFLSVSFKSLLFSRNYFSFYSYITKWFWSRGWRFWFGVSCLRQQGSSHKSKILIWPLFSDSKKSSLSTDLFLVFLIYYRYRNNIHIFISFFSRSFLPPFFLLYSFLGAVGFCGFSSQAIFCNFFCYWILYILLFSYVFSTASKWFHLLFLFRGESV